MDDLKEHIKIVLEGKFSNSNYLKLRDKFSVDTSTSTWTKVGSILNEHLSNENQL